MHWFTVTLGKSGNAKERNMNFQVSIIFAIGCEMFFARFSLSSRGGRRWVSMSCGLLLKSCFGGQRRHTSKLRLIEKELENYFLFWKNLRNATKKISFEKFGNDTFWCLKTEVFIKMVFELSFLFLSITHRFSINQVGSLIKMYSLDLCAIH